MKKYLFPSLIFLTTLASAQLGYRYSVVPGSPNKYATTYKEIKAVSYGATISVTPFSEFTTYNVDQLTGAATINAVITQTYTGDRIIFLFNADGTNRVVTFNTNFTALGTFTIPASTYASCEFVFNGSAWYEISRQNNVSGSVTTLLAGNGTVGAPSVSFTNDNDCGLYRIGANNTGVAENGAKVLDIATTGLGVTGVLTCTGLFSPAAAINNSAGSVGAPAYSYTGQTNMGSYKISSTQLGFSVGGGLQGGFNTTGLFTNYISEQTSGQGITLSHHVVHVGSVTTYTTTANVTGAAISGGVVAYTGSAHTLTLPSTAAIVSAIGASGAQGTYFDFVLDNTGGSGTVTLALDASMTAVSAVTGGTTLTLVQSATAGQAGFRVTFISPTVSIISRLY